eukprot:9554729-Alexandrium_andersonii.AAC.1
MAVFGIASRSCVPTEPGDCDCVPAATRERTRTKLLEAARGCAKLGSLACRAAPARRGGDLRGVSETLEARPFGRSGGPWAG